MYVHVYRGIVRGAARRGNVFRDFPMFIRLTGVALRILCPPLNAGPFQAEEGYGINAQIRESKYGKRQECIDNG